MNLMFSQANEHNLTKSNQNNEADASIPFPQYTSWMHQRIPLKQYSNEELLAGWRRQPVFVQAIEAVLSRIAKFFHAFSPSRRYIVYRFFNTYFYWYLKIFNRLRIHHADRIPKTGVIIYISHHSAFDPLIIFACKPTYFFGSFMHWGTSWFADVADKYLGLVAKKAMEGRDIQVEKMIRVFLTQTPFFAIAPEGLVAHDKTVRQGFSSFIDAYATINSLKDRIPLMPVIIRGAEKYRNVKPNTSPIDIHFMKPFFLPRQWLLPQEQGGKTQREITDRLMRIIAHQMGQNNFEPNPGLDRSREHKRLKSLKTE